MELAESEELLVNWGTKGFSLNVVLNGNNISILEGYPPDMSSAIYASFRSLRQKVADPKAIEEWYTAELDRLSGTTSTATGNRKCVVDGIGEEEANALIVTLKAVAERIRQQGLAA